MDTWSVLLGSADAPNVLSHFGLAFGAALVVLLFTVPVALRRIRRLQSDLDRASAELRETTGFLSRFSNGIWQSDGVDGVMHAAALNVAERVDAESAWQTYFTPAITTITSTGATQKPEAVTMAVLNTMTPASICGCPVTAATGSGLPVRRVCILSLITNAPPATSLHFIAIR